MIHNMFVALFWSYLVWLESYVFGIDMNVLHFLCIWSVFCQTFFSFYFYFLSLIHFKFWFCFLFGFQVNLVFFYSVYSWTKGLRSTWSGQIRVKWLRLCLACNVFAKVFFFFTGVFGKHPLSHFYFKKNRFSSNKA